MQSENGFEWNSTTSILPRRTEKYCRRYVIGGIVPRSAYGKRVKIGALGKEFSDSEMPRVSKTGGFFVAPQNGNTKNFRQILVKNRASSNRFYSHLVRRAGIALKRIVYFRLVET